MPMIRPPLLVAAAHLLALAALAAPAPAHAQEGRTLRQFRGRQEWVEYNARLWREVERLRREGPPSRGVIIEGPSPYPPAPPPRSPDLPVQSFDVPRAGPSRTVVRPDSADDEVLAQVHGEFLVMLHRGRLFTVRIGGGALEPVSVVDAFALDTDPGQTRYRELLVSGDRVVVMGFGWSRSDVGLGVFHLAPDGRLTYRATYSLDAEGDDFNGVRQYATRLVGDRFVFYAPLSTPHPERSAEWFSDFPQISRRDSRVAPTSPTRVYRPAEGHVGRDMHTLTSCRLDGDDLRCQSTALYAPSSVPFHLSPTAVYLWARKQDRWWDESAAPRYVLYRLPYDGSAPTALGVAGHPWGEFSFHESADGHLNVLILKDASGARMWGEDRGLALLRVPLSALGDGSRSAAAAQYRPLPGEVRGGFRTRFVGDWLVYGTGAFTLAGEMGLERSTAYAVHVAGGGVSEIPLATHGVDRIEPTGSGAMIIGSDGVGVHVSSLRLDPAGVTVADHHVIAAAPEGYTQVLGAYHQAGEGNSGVLGLPLLGPARPGAPLPTLGSARTVFVRNQGPRLDEAGELAAADPAADDGCVAGCQPWFGNARPLFVDGRILALMGYELVEGRVEDGRVREVRRVSFTPVSPAETIAGDWEFTETLGPVVGPYRCSHRGTLRLDRDGRALTLRYRQTGECFVNDVARSSDGEGGGEGTIAGLQLDLRVNGCTYRGRMEHADAFTVRVSCPVTLPNGPTITVEGSLQARRARP